MGLIANIKNFIASKTNGANVRDVTVDPGGETNITARHFSGAGEDSHPLETDYVFVNDIQATGGTAAVGYLDPLNEHKAAKGERRTYSRNSAGEVVAEVWLKNDGSVEIINENGRAELTASGAFKAENSNGSVDLQAAGDVIINGVTIDTSGNISTAGNITTTAKVTASQVEADSVKAANKELANHRHSGVTSGGSMTGPNT